MLIIVLDMNSLCRGSKNSNVVDINNIITAISLFCASFSVMHRENQLVFLASGNKSVDVVFTTESAPSKFSISELIINALQPLMSKMNKMTEDSLKHGSMSQCFSKSLCIVNRFKQLNQQLQCRILVMQFDKDVEQSYNALMNSIFR